MAAVTAEKNKGIHEKMHKPSKNVITAVLKAFCTEDWKRKMILGCGTTMHLDIYYLDNDLIWHTHTPTQQLSSHAHMQTNNSLELTRRPSDINIDLWKQSFLPACIIRSINIAARWCSQHYRPVAGSVIGHTFAHTHPYTHKNATKPMSNSKCQILCCTQNVCYISNYRCNTQSRNTITQHWLVDHY